MKRTEMLTKIEGLLRSKGIHEKNSLVSTQVLAIEILNLCEDENMCLVDGETGSTGWEEELCPTPYCKSCGKLGGYSHHGQCPERIK